MQNKALSQNNLTRETCRPRIESGNVYGNWKSYFATSPKWLGLGDNCCWAHALIPLSSLFEPWDKGV